VVRAKHQTPTPSGTLAQIRIDGVLHRKHFKRGTDPIQIKEWLLKTEVRFRGARATRTGRFDDDAKVYLETVKAMPSFTDRKLHIEEWIAVFKGQLRYTITSDQIRAQLAHWRTTPRTVTISRRPSKTGKPPRTRELTLSASAVNKRRTALMHMFTVLDGKAEPNPVKDAPPYQEPDPLPRGLPYAAIRELWTVMGDTKTRARLQAMAYTGLPHAQLAQVKPEDVDLKAGTMVVHARKKGSGTRASVRPLTPAAVKAFKAMARTDAWGTFSRGTMRRHFREACKQVTALQPIADTLTPYDLRHSFGTETYRVSGDRKATSDLMGHTTERMTRRYVMAAEAERMRVALSGFGRKRKG
jgi:integrase